MPAWVDAARLLGPGFRPAEGGWTADLPPAAAADVDARLRGVGLGGAPLRVTVTPPLPRAAVRAARLADARRRRDASPGFTRPGTRLDEEGRWSLTPEALALALGRLAGARPVIDATCGAGGNTIGFARAGATVHAVERDPDRLALARHNARVYGVADRITFHLGDAEALLPRLPAALVFVDPPWGPEWSRARTAAADLPALGPILAAAGPRPVWVKAPPSFDPATLPGFTPRAWFGVAEGDRRRVKFVLLRRD